MYLIVRTQEYCYSIYSMDMLPGILPTSSVPGLLMVSAGSECSVTWRLASSRRLNNMALKCIDKGTGVVLGRGRVVGSIRDTSGTGFRRRLMRCRMRRSMIIVGV